MCAFYFYFIFRAIFLPSFPILPHAYSASSSSSLLVVDGDVVSLSTTRGKTVFHWYQNVLYVCCTMCLPREAFTQGYMCINFFFLFLPSNRLSPKQPPAISTLGLAPLGCCWLLLPTNNEGAFAFVLLFPQCISNSLSLFISLSLFPNRSFYFLLFKNYKTNVY